VEVEELRPVPLAQVRGGDPGREQQRRQRDQEQVEAVEAELVVDPERGDPRLVGEELQARGVGVEGEQVVDRQPERDQRAAEHDPRRPARSRDRAHQGEGERPPDEDREGHGYELESRK